VESAHLLCTTDHFQTGFRICLRFHFQRCLSPTSCGIGPSASHNQLHFTPVTSKLDSPFKLLFVAKDHVQCFHSISSTQPSMEFSQLLTRGGMNTARMLRETDQSMKKSKRTSEDVYSNSAFPRRRCYQPVEAQSQPARSRLHRIAHRHGRVNCTIAFTAKDHIRCLHSLSRSQKLHRNRSLFSGGGMNTARMLRETDQSMKKSKRTSEDVYSNSAFPRRRCYQPVEAQSQPARSCLHRIAHRHGRVNRTIPRKGVVIRV